MSSLSRILTALPIVLTLACGSDAPDQMRNPSTSSRDASTSGSRDGGTSALGSRAVAEVTPLVSDDEPTAPSEDELSDGAVSIRGTATFTTTKDGVVLDLALRGCLRNRAYPIAIYEADSCDELMGSDKPSVGARGMGIPIASCVAGSIDMHVERDVDEQPWTVGGAKKSNVVGQIIALHHPVTMAPIACGEIEASAAAPMRDAGLQPSESVAVRAHVAGICTTKLIARSSTHECPEPEPFAECAAEKCELNECLDACKSYSACIEGEEDPCETSCEKSAACEECMAGMFSCMFSKCREVLACGAPRTPGGPCAQVEECCMKQGDRAGFCLDILSTTESISGDPSCAGLLVDWDFLTNIANDPPCTELPPDPTYDEPDAGDAGSAKDGGVAKDGSAKDGGAQDAARR